MGNNPTFANRVFKILYTLIVISVFLLAGLGTQTKEDIEKKRSDSFTLPSHRDNHDDHGSKK